MCRSLLKNENVVTLGVLFIFLILLILPSANYHIFSGLPFSQIPEFVVFILLLPLLVSRLLRRLYRRLLFPGGKQIYVWLLLGAGLIAIGTKLVLFWAGGYEGFWACYRSPAAPPVATPCEKSYENALFRFSATRIDPTIIFDETNWNLSFFNSMRFNFYPWVEGNILRDRLPITVNWHGTIDPKENGSIQVIFIGEAKLSLGGEPVRLGPQYQSLGNAIIPIAAGRRDIAIDYTFDDGYRVGQGPVPGPGATFQLWYVSSPDGNPPAVPFSPISPPLVWQVLGKFIDLVVICFAAGILYLYAMLLRSEWAIVAGVALSALVLLLPASVDQGLKDLLLIGVTCLLFLYLFARNRRRHALLAYLAFLYLGIVRILCYYPNLSAVRYASAGDDWLTYESFARSILDTGSLEAGEKVFYLQPLFRYIKFAEHIVWGDGDVWIAAFALGSFNLAIFSLFARLYRRLRPKLRYLIPILSGTLLFILANSESVVWWIRVGLSEYPTWIFLPLLFWMLFASWSEKQWLIGTLLLGACLLIRTDEAPILLPMFSIFCVVHFQRKPFIVLSACLILVFTALLPAIHNLYYGHQLALLPGSGSSPANLVLPPTTLEQVFRNSQVRDLVSKQLTMLFPLDRIFTIADSPWYLIFFPFTGLLLCWCLSTTLALLSKRRNASTLLVGLTPLAFFGAHIVYQVATYYPRLIVFGYLALGIVAVFQNSELIMDKRERPRRSLSPSRSLP